MRFVKLTPGARFTVRNDFPTEFGMLLPGSTGFISFVSLSLVGNYIKPLATVNIVMTRKGKKGKDRFESVKIKIPTLYDENLAKNDSVKFNSIYKKCPIITTDNSKTDILKMSSLDFAAWALCYKNYVHMLIGRVHGVNIKLPQKHNHPFNVINSIYNKFYEDGAEEAFKNIDSLPFRNNIINSIRENEAKTTAITLKHKNLCGNVHDAAFRDLYKMYKQSKVPKSYTASAKATQSLAARDGQKFIKTLTI